MKTKISWIVDAFYFECFTKIEHTLKQKYIHACVFTLSLQTHTCMYTIAVSNL